MLLFISPLHHHQVAPEVTCPVCRSSTGENDVMDNFFVAASRDSDSNSCGGDMSGDDGGGGHRCDCDETATSRCADCNDYLCGDCVAAHLRVKTARDHVITRLKMPKRSSSSSSMANYNICSYHPGEKLR